MIFAQCPVTNFDCLPIERLGFGILALIVKQPGKIVVASCNVWMIVAERYFHLSRWPADERLSFGVILPH